MVFIEYFNDKTPTEQIDRIVRLIEQYQPIKITVESNSIGNIYFDMLQKRVKRRIIKFTTTNDSKNKIIDKLGVALENKEIGCSISGINFNKHGKAHIVRAAQEGIVFSFKYGIEIMEQMGMKVNKIHAGHANMFLSPIFRNTLAGVTGAVIDLYDTDGSVGAAKGAGIGAGIYKDNTEAFATLEKLAVIEPSDVDEYAAAYEVWKSRLEK